MAIHARARSAGAAARPPPGRLRRELTFWPTAALSVGVMAPTLAMSITGIEASRLLGRAAPLAYALAAVGVALVAYGFVRLAGLVGSAGSVYAFVGEALGPRAGFFAGWALLGTYIVFPPTSLAAIGVFGEAFAKSTGISANPEWLPIALGGWALTWLVASRQIRTATLALLVFEVTSVALILVLVIVIFVRLAAGDAPRGQALNGDFVDLPAGIGVATVALAGTAGFLSFAGFESAGSLGEESFAPTRAIPRSLGAAVGFGAVFYVVCMTAQTLGFGTDAAGVRAFSSSEAPLGDLATAYVGRGMAHVLDAAAMVSALGAALGGVAVGSRMLFAMGRDGVLARSWSHVSAGTGAPALALATVMALSATGLLILGLAGNDAIDVFFYFATPGVLCLLCMYAVTNLAAARTIARTGGRARLELIIPVAGIGVALYTLYRNVWPVPDHPFNLFPYLVGGWLAVGLVLAVVRVRPR